MADSIKTYLEQLASETEGIEGLAAEHAAGLKLPEKAWLTSICERQAKLASNLCQLIGYVAGMAEQIDGHSDLESRVSALITHEKAGDDGPCHEA